MKKLLVNLMLMTALAFNVLLVSAQSDYEPPYIEPLIDQDYDEPDYDEPDYNEPDYNEPDYNEPDYNEPDYNEPDYDEPDYDEPDYDWEPDANETDESEPINDALSEKTAYAFTGDNRSDMRRNSSPTHDLSSQINASQFEIKIERTFQISSCITGYLSINGNPAICNTLELPWFYNVAYMSCIPKGKYAATIREAGKLGWRIQLEGVQGRKYVQIHLGNYISDTEGCILVGEDSDPAECKVSESTKALNYLRREFETQLLLGTINMCPEIIVTIE